jgi:hypothetical protein
MCQIKSLEWMRNGSWKLRLAHAGVADEEANVKCAAWRRGKKKSPPGEAGGLASSGCRQGRHPWRSRSGDQNDWL